MSLFGWREKRKIEQQQRRIETLVEQLDDARKLAGIHQGNLVRMAQARAAQHDENTRLRKEAADYGQMLTREVIEADEDVTAEGARAVRYRLAWQSARRRATEAQKNEAAARNIRRYLGRACARYRADLAAQRRVTDFLGQQLLDSVSGHDTRLRAPAAAAKSSEVTAS